MNTFVPSSPRVGSGKKGLGKTLIEIQRLTSQRESRRKSAEDMRIKRANEIKKNERKGTPGDVDFQRMIRKFRKYQIGKSLRHQDIGPVKINVVVRKRPVNQREIKVKDFDCLTCSNPYVYVHSCKFKVDGITKELNTISICF